MKTYLGLVALSTCAIAGDWLTYGHDPQRTSWASEETKIAPDTVAKMTLAWKTSLKNEPYMMSALHAPRGWKHLNAFFVQLFLKTHFAPAGTAMASRTTKAKRNVCDFFVDGMVPFALQIRPQPVKKLRRAPHARGAG